jgi:transposase
MSEPTCSGCRERDQRLARLEEQLAELTAEVRDLKARLGQNASNSSLPPSANPSGAPKPVVKKPTGRKPGGQPGHPPHMRVRLPFKRLKEVIHYVPKVCEDCQAALPAKPGPKDPEPVWHQVAELAETLAEITEYQAHGRTCRRCGHLTCEKIPDDIRAHVTGPRLTAIMAYLSGRPHVSKRGIEEIVEAVFGAPIALGTVANLEQEMSAALAAAHAEARQAVQNAPSKHVDETGWKRAGKTCWLWAAATTVVAYFVIHPSRGTVGLTALLGQKIKGIVCSDRWSVYSQLKLGLRQLCWAHLKRDFQKLVDRGGEAQSIGEMGLGAVEVVFEVWHRFRGGGTSRRQMQREIAGIRQTLGEWLERGCACADSAASNFCANVLAVEPAMWTFVYKEDVEPTNNHIERLLRSGVLWRKKAFGCHSERGCRFVERILTVVQTLRLQKRPVLDFLYQALVAHRHRQRVPNLVLGG